METNRDRINEAIAQFYDKTISGRQLAMLVSYYINHEDATGPGEVTEGTTYPHHVK